MNKKMREMLDEAIELAENTPRPTQELVRRTYDLRTSRSNKAYYIAEKLHQDSPCRAFN